MLQDHVFAAGTASAERKQGNGENSGGGGDEGADGKTAAGEDAGGTGIHKASYPHGVNASYCVCNTDRTSMDRLYMKGGEIMKLTDRFFKEEDAVGTVELILILVVLIGLVLIFKKQITNLTKNILQKVTNQSNQI